MKVVFCVPFLHRPQEPMRASLEAAVPLLDQFGIEHRMMHEQGNAYISGARATMLRKALDWLRDPEDAVCFLDYDLSARPQDYLKLLVTPGECVAGTYRYKKAEEEYMGAWHVNPDGIPMARADGCIKASAMPAGFLRLTLPAIDRFMLKYPELNYGPAHRPSVDLFNHGAHTDREWWGEDFAFCRRFIAAGGDCWLIPSLQLTHWEFPAAKPEILPDGREVLIPQPGIAFHGCLGNYLQRQPGGLLDPKRPPEPTKEELMLRAAADGGLDPELLAELARRIGPPPPEPPSPIHTAADQPLISEAGAAIAPPPNYGNSGEPPAGVS